ncbi:hypothetical protein Zmor_019910 [Zophobas morio]|uniref:Ricin B lectin domain-containing protein n=1 Tax=Zophobas morio TaxID=2755281 RepID=A0AA38I6L0_9CUCU|nr:hypothetical protein Zmor_019910 [Zophobas morio]
MVLQLKCLVAFLLFHGVLLALETWDDNSLFLIRSTASNLVLDSRESKVTIQHFDGYKPQLWKFKRGDRPGLFIIVNNNTGTVLDVDKSNQNTIILAKENDSLNQQWILNSNGRIINAGMKLTVDIIHARYVPGNPVIVRTDNGNAAQDFIVKEKITCGLP